MILVIVWDGLRPDMVTPEQTPYLYATSQRGVFCQASHAAFPTATRINASSLATGCYPARHGIVDNELYIPAVDPTKATSCADWEALQRMAHAEGGPLLTAPTLGEILRGAGHRLACVGSGSPGTTYLTNPAVTGPVVNWAVAWPAGLQTRLVESYGAMLPETSTSFERNTFVLRVLNDVLIPEYRPDVVVVWLTEPDHAQHAHGLRSPQALDALRILDETLQQLVARLEAAAPRHALDCILISDHGFSTIAETVDVNAALVDAGLKEAPDANDIVRASNSLYLNGSARERLPEVVEFLQRQPWLGAVLVRDDLLPAVPGSMPQSAAFGHHPRSAEVMYANRWWDGANANDTPGCVVQGASLAATHGSASPYDVNNTLIAWGPSFKQGVVSAAPCGIVDVAPTVLRLLGLPFAASMQGRVLDELLRDGPGPDALPVTRSAREALLMTPDGLRRQTAAYSTVAGHTYLDQITLTEPH